VSPARRRPRGAGGRTAARAASGEGRPRTIEGSLDGTGLRVAIVLSRFNELIGERLLEGALRALDRHGVRPADVVVARVPGAFELPIVASRLARSGRHHAVVCLGAVLRGETPHFEWVAGEAARGIARVSQETGTPVLFGVLTVDTLEQALDRAGGKLGNRGAEAAQGAVEMATLLRALDSRERA
jgi:6,7-dimethyl-8-ribityllumazine synthase